MIYSYKEEDSDIFDFKEKINLKEDCIKLEGKHIPAILSVFNDNVFYLIYQNEQSCIETDI